MDFPPTHTGLYFSTNEIQLAQENGSSLEDMRNEISIPSQDTILGDAYWNAMQYRILGNPEAGELAVRYLDALSSTTSKNDVNSLYTIFQIIELVRKLLADKSQIWSVVDEMFSDIQGMQTAENEPDQVERLWLRLAGSVVFEDETLFRQCTDELRSWIDRIHPEGYIKEFVDRSMDDEAYLREFRFVRAMVLSAEIAFHAGDNLWSYTSRGGVSIATSISYILYYYYYPEKWIWDAGQTEEAVQELFATHGAFMEIANKRVEPRGIELLLEDQRPMFDLYGGGCTSLTHFHVKQKKRRSLFDWF